MSLRLTTGLGLLSLVTCGHAFVRLVPPAGRLPTVSAVAGAAAWDDAWSAGRTAADAEGNSDEELEWLTLAGCDVLLPRRRVKAVVHFVGGALVGVAPRQAYGAFLESLGARGGLVIVCTPCSSLTSLDHWGAASEVMLRWCAATPAIDTALAERGLEPLASLPVFGLGHSLGAKLLLLLGSEQSMAEAAGPRAANALVSFNNFPASRSVPLFEQAIAMGGGLQAGGLQAAVGAVDAVAAAGRAAGDQVSDIGARLQRGEALGDSLGELGASLGAGLGDLGAKLGANVGGSPAAPLPDFADGLRAAADAFASMGGETASSGAYGRGVADGAGGSGADFSPTPAETEELVLQEYRVGRNLVVRFVDDSLDQSVGLGQASSVY